MSTKSKTSVRSAAKAAPATKPAPAAAKHVAPAPVVKPMVKSMPLMKPSVALKAVPALKTVPPAKNGKADDVGFASGDHVVYPTHGVGKITEIVNQEIAGHKLRLLVITFDKDRMTLRV